jgi:hypothetical protein
MSRAVVLTCIFCLSSAGVLCQVEDACAFAATIAELSNPGSVDPVDSPCDHPGDSLIRAGTPLETPDAPSFLDGLLPLPRLDLGVSAAHGLLRESAGHAPPPASTLRRLSRLQVFRN